MDRESFLDLVACVSATIVVSVLVQRFWIGSFVSSSDAIPLLGCVVVIGTLLTWKRLRHREATLVASSLWGALFGFIGGIVGYIAVQVLGPNGVERVGRAIDFFPWEFPVVVLGFPLVLLTWIVGAAGGAAIAIRRFSTSTATRRVRRD